MTQIIQQDMPKIVGAAGDAVLWYALTGQLFTDLALVLHHKTVFLQRK
jgi:hypothetical protein